MYSFLPTHPQLIQNRRSQPRLKIHAKNVNKVPIPTPSPMTTARIFWGKYLKSNLFQIIFSFSGLFHCWFSKYMFHLFTELSTTWSHLCKSLSKEHSRRRQGQMQRLWHENLVHTAHGPNTVLLEHGHAHSLCVVYGFSPACCRYCLLSLGSSTAIITVQQHRPGKA